MQAICMHSPGRADVIGGKLCQSVEHRPGAGFLTVCQADLLGRLKTRDIVFHNYKKGAAEPRNPLVSVEDA